MITNALYIIQSPPYSSHSAIEALEMAMMSASFELPTSLLFIYDGVFQLKKGQMTTSENGLKNSGKMFKAAPDFEIAPLYVDQLSLVARGLSTEDLNTAVQPVDSAQIRDLIANTQQVVVL